MRRKGKTAGKQLRKLKQANDEKSVHIKRGKTLRGQTHSRFLMAENA